MASTSLVARFPQELIDKIVVENGTDVGTLRSSALVCRSFVRSSQAAIFSSIEFVPTRSKSTHGRELSSRLYILLQRSPHLSSYIHALTIHESGLRSEDRWMAADPCLIPVLGMLHSLTSFTLWGRSWDFRWDELPRELRAAICALCTRSALVKLSLAALGNMVDPGEFASLMASPELADLSVWQTAPSLGSVPYPRFQLVGCQLGIAAPTLDFPIHWLVEGDAFANLQFLNLAWVPETTWHVQRLINSCPASLQEFFLEMRDDPEAYPTTLDLSQIPALLSLVLQVDINDHSARVIASWIAELLHGVNAPDIKVSGILRAMEIPIDWTPLASSLHPERFPCLQHFTVEFIGWHHWREVSSERLQEIVDTVKRELQELEERGVLKCRMVNEG